MARFLFCSLSSPGFLFPAVGIGVALRKRGHTVAVLTDPAHSALLEHQGLELIHCDGQSGTCFRVELWGKLASVALQVKLLEKAMKTFPPDVIVGQQLTLAPLIVRERLKVPVGIIGFFTSLWPKWPPLVDDAPAQCIAHKNWLFEEMLKLYNASRSLFQLPHYPLSARELPFTGDLFMLRTIRELEGDISHLPEQVHLVGSCLWDNEQENDELEAWLREEAWSDRPVLYIQHGRLFDKPHFWPALLQGTENL
jgi:UDP:flavonoid glycosyltransferase YjiC (YdhE family)